MQATHLQRRAAATRSAFCAARWGLRGLLLLAACLTPASSASAQRLLPGEFSDISLGRQLIEPARFPTISELRAALSKPQVSTVMMLKLYADGNNHYLPVWAPDGQGLAFQRSDVSANLSKLLVFSPLSQEKPTLLSDNRDNYDYMFRWGINSPRSMVFARIEGASRSSQICFSADGTKVEVRSTGKGRIALPTLYRRTDGIWRLYYERAGEIVQDSWSDASPQSKLTSLARGLNPRWSYDGTRLLYLRDSGSKTTPPEVVVHDVTTEQEVVLPSPRTGTIRSPVWSASGDYVGFFVREPGENKPWRIHVCAAGKGTPGRAVGDEVVVNVNFESEGPSFEPSGRRVWYFSAGHRQQAYFPLVGAAVNTGETVVVDYPNRCTTPVDLAVNPASEIPEMAFAAHDGLPQDVFVVLLNHY